MALSTYADLKSSVLTTLLRDADSDASTRFDDWLAKFEAFARRELSGANLGEVVSQNASVSNEYTALPSNLISIRSAAITVSGYRRDLRAMTPTAMDNLYSSLTGTPEAYAIVGSSMRLGPPPNSTYTVRLTYTALTPLTSTNTTNWLLTAAPDVYEAGVLGYAHAFYEDADSAAKNMDAAASGIAALVKQSKRNLPASGMAPRIIGGVV